MRPAACSAYHGRIHGRTPGTVLATRPNVPNSPFRIFPCLRSREHNEAIGRDNYVCRRFEAMQRRAGCIDTSAVAGHDRVHPVIIDIAVEYFPPRTSKWESDAVVVPGILGERGD